MKLKFDFADKIAQIFIIDSSHIAYPFMGVRRLWFFTQRKSHWPINIREHNRAFWIHKITTTEIFIALAI